jgi:AraC-like DNA-binding protein
MRERHEKPTSVLVAPAAVRSWLPGPVLRPFVESYSLREDRLGDVELYHPLPARADCFLQFYLADRYRVVNVASAQVHCAPRCVLVGPHSRRREDLVWAGHLKIFTIRFRSVGFRALFGIPAKEIRDVAEAAEAVVGTRVRELEARVQQAEESELPAIAERFLMECFARAGAAPGGGAAAGMVRMLRVRHGAAAVSELAGPYGFSERHAERLFLEHVGVSPKVFGRLTRMSRALALRAENSAANWAGIANDAGYFDQSHMVREFRELNGTTPVEFAELGRRARMYRAVGRGDVGFVLSGGADAGAG